MLNNKDNKLNNEKLVGKTFEELNLDEMNEVQGAGDTNPESTTVSIVSVSLAAAFSAVKCGRK